MEEYLNVNLKKTLKKEPMTPIPQKICSYTAIFFFLNTVGMWKKTVELNAILVWWHMRKEITEKKLTKDYVQLVRQKRQAYVKQTDTFHWGYQRKLEEQLARKRLKSKFKKK